MPQSNQSVVDDAAVDPALLFHSSLGTPDGETRDSGLILTKDQIKNLKRYELKGLALPTQLKDVIAYLGYETGAGRGLEAADFQGSFELIQEHARLWNPLRTDLLTVGDKLVVFAGSMQVYGQSMGEVLDDIRALGLVEKHNIRTLEDLRNVELELGIKFPGIERADREDLGYFLDRILQKVREQEAEANAIKFRLDDFGRQLANRVAPDIKLRLAYINNNNLGAEIKALQVKIDNRAKDIDEKTKEYQKLVKDAIAAIATGGMILVIYTSVQAEKVRKERDKMRKAQEADLALMEQKDRILASLGRVRMDMQDLDLVVIDADIATKNLITVWNKLSTFINESVIEVNGINDGLSMRRFKNQFQLVVKPWETIEVDARKLLDVFAEADREFRQEYGV